MTDLALFVQLQARVTAFLAEQSVDQLKALAAGTATLVIADGSSAPLTAVAKPPATPPQVVRKPPKTTRRPAAKTAFDAEAVVAKLRDCEEVDQATALLAEHKLTLSELKDVVRALDLTPKGRKDDVMRQIVNQTVGARRKYDGLRAG